MSKITAFICIPPVFVFMRQSITHRGRKSKSRPMRAEEKGSRRGQTTAAAASVYWLTTSRYRNVTTCARVQVFSGQNSAALIPFVMPCSTAHRTALP